MGKKCKVGGGITPSRVRGTKDEILLKVLEADEIELAAVRRALTDSPEAMKKDSAPLFVTIKEAAARCGFSRKTIYNLIKAGRLQPVEIKPGMRRIRTMDLDRLAATKEVLS